MRARLMNVGIGRRLALAFAAVGAILCVVAGVGLSGVSSEKQSTGRVSDAAQMVSAALDLKFQAADFNGWQTMYGFDAIRGVKDATSDAVGSRRDFLASAQRFRALVATARKLPYSAAQRHELDGLESAFSDFMNLDATVIADYRAGTRESVQRANALVAGEEVTLFEKIATHVDRLVASAEADRKSDSANAASAASRARTLLLLFAGLALLVAAVLALLVTRSITRPLALLESRLHEIADGDGDLTQKLDEQRSDEIGRVSRAFNRFVAKIAATVTSINETAVGLSGAAEELSSISTQLAGSAEETASQAGVVAQASEEVTRTEQNVSAAVEQMGSTVAEIARTAADAAGVATEALTMTEATNKAMEQLAQSSNHIGEVVKVITAIAKQTDLLALNATIEAARAGESGKGFAVVAGEVKELAKQSADATGEIVEKVAAIQRDVSTAVDDIHKINEIVTRIADGQSTIAAAVEEQTATTNDISSNLSAAVEGGGQISASIAGVADAAAGTTQGAQQMQVAATDLSRMAGELTALVGQFRT